MDKPMYIRRIDPNEYIVNNILKEGYNLHSITTKLSAGYTTDTIYHFIYDTERAMEKYPELKLGLSEIEHIKDSYN